MTFAISALWKVGQLWRSDWDGNPLIHMWPLSEQFERPPWGMHAQTFERNMWQVGTEWATGATDFTKNEPALSLFLRMWKVEEYREDIWKLVGGREYCCLMVAQKVSKWICAVCCGCFKTNIPGNHFSPSIDNWKRFSRCTWKSIWTMHDGDEKCFLQYFDCSLGLVVRAKSQQVLPGGKICTNLPEKHMRKTIKFASFVANHKMQDPLLGLKQVCSDKFCFKWCQKLGTLMFNSLCTEFQENFVSNDVKNLVLQCSMAFILNSSDVVTSKMINWPDARYCLCF